MTHTQQDHDVYQGQDWLNTVTVYLSETSADTAFITGWALEATFAPSSTGRINEELTKTNGAGVTITNGGAGVCTIALSSDETTDMSGEWEWSLWRISEGSKTPLSIGTLHFKETARSRRSSTT
jgi:hypothetical protein